MSTTKLTTDVPTYVYPEIPEKFTETYSVIFPISKYVYKWRICICNSSLHEQLKTGCFDEIEAL